MRLIWRVTFFGYNDDQVTAMPAKKYPLILHPFLFAAYAILGVYSKNTHEEF